MAIIIQDKSTNAHADFQKIKRHKLQKNNSFMFSASKLYLLYNKSKFSCYTKFAKSNMDFGVM